MIITNISFIYQLINHLKVLLKQLTQMFCLNNTHEKEIHLAEVVIRDLAIMGELSEAKYAI